MIIVWGVICCSGARVGRVFCVCVVAVQHHRGWWLTTHALRGAVDVREALTPTPPYTLPELYTYTDVCYRYNLQLNPYTHPYQPYNDLLPLPDLRVQDEVLGSSELLRSTCCQM